MKLIGVCIKYSVIAILIVTTMISSVSADTVSDLQGKQDSAQKQLDNNNNQLSNEISAVNQVYQDIQQLNTEKKEMSDKITAVKQKLVTAKIEKQKRITDAKERLRELQLREGTNTTIQILENSSNLTQWLGNIIALGRLQAVYNDSLGLVKQSVNQIENDQKQLLTYQSSLNVQSRSLVSKKNQMTTSLNSLKQLVKNNQVTVATLANKVAWAKESAAEEAAAKNAEQTTQANSTQATNSTSSTTASSQSEDANSNTSSTSNSSEATATTTNISTSKTLVMQSTGYSTEQSGLSAYSATGINLREHPNCIAVDPSVIPLGSIVWVSGYGVTVAGDTGGAIKGNIIDVHFATVGQANSWGRRTVTVKILS